MTSKAKPKPKPTKPSLKSLQKQIVGTWRLISAEDRKSSGKPWVPYTFGNPPSGYFIYDPTGHASIQIMTTPPKKIDKKHGPTPKQARAIFKAYTAYYGTYTIDEATSRFKLKARGTLVR